MDSLLIDKQAGNPDFIGQEIPLDEIAFIVSMHLNDSVYNSMDVFCRVLVNVFTEVASTAKFSLNGSAN